ncbi:MAG: toll/interleukin-1 receptor domain-containing protein, partial [Crocinitomicaceae bacterium]|nr:toll/interleukin-1 receptor domain-containing protein [Crocinitomicaceae bacterium]
MSENNNPSNKPEPAKVVGHGHGHGHGHDGANSGIIKKAEYFDVFISYKRDHGEDHGEKLAESLYTKLKADGYKVWIDNMEIGYAANFVTRLEEAIIHS